MNIDVNVEGDIACGYIIDCLVDIAVLYGSAFITLQYLPFCADLLNQAMRKLTKSLESAAIASIVFLQVICNCLSDKQIMDHLEVILCFFLT